MCEDIKGAVYMSQTSPVSQADSCHEYFFLATKEDLNQIRVAFASKLIFLLKFILRKF